MDATLSNKAILMLPWWTSYLIMLKVFLHSCFFLTVLHGSHQIIAQICFWLVLTCFLQHLVPSPAMMKLSTAFGSNCSMDQVIIVITIAVTIYMLQIIIFALFSN